ncbi:hypothetical protein [Streptomyces sp. NPDC046859]|uniref:hypothetical protein n=1 Tax=Streptomyces sp. NPDC046859 TaxID=3155734 RepID=UPI0033ED09E1
MSTRPSLNRRIIAAVFGVERPGRGSRAATARRDLPYGRRLLAAVLGVRAGARQIPAHSEPRARGQEAGENPAETLQPPTTQTPHLRAKSVAPDPTPQPRPDDEESRDNPGPQEPPSLPPLRAPRRPHAGAEVRSFPQWLLGEDRQEYERLLDEAVRSAPHRPELAAAGRRLNTEQLRAMALNATDLITSAAATEYQHYVAVREEMRAPAARTRQSDAPTTVGLATAVRGMQEPPDADADAGAGAAAVAAALTPVLAGTAATIFLGVGYLLELVGRASSFSNGLITTGWIFGAVTAAGILVAAAGLLLSALRNGRATETGAHGDLGPEVEQARDAWRAALLERGILPFLRDALTHHGTTSAPHRAASPHGGIPQLGYGRPGFGSPQDEPTAGPRPSFTSPDFTSPDFTSPDFTSPDFGGPEQDPE